LYIITVNNKIIKLLYNGIFYDIIIFELRKFGGDLLVYILLNITGRLVITLLYVMQFLMFGRALMSWFFPEEDNKIARFLFVITEPLVYPIRQLLSKIEFFNTVPIDMSFLFAMIILIILTTALGGGLI